MLSSVQTVTAPPDVNMPGTAEVSNSGAASAVSTPIVAINPVSDYTDNPQQSVLPTSDFQNTLLPDIFSLETSPAPGNGNNITSSHDAYQYFEDDHVAGPAPRLISYAEPSIPCSTKLQQLISDLPESRQNEQINGNILDENNMNDTNGDSHPEATYTSSLAGSEPRIQAFAKLEFDDGHFYVNTYSFILGRDIRALRAAIKKETASQPSRAASRNGLVNGASTGVNGVAGTGGPMSRKFSTQSNQQFQPSMRQNDEKEYMGGSVVSDKGGIMGFDPDVPQQFSHVLSWKSTNPSSVRESRSRPPMLHMSSAPTPAPALPADVESLGQNSAADIPPHPSLPTNPDFVDADADVDVNDVVQKDYNALAMESLQPQQDSNEAKPVDTFSLLPSPHACPTIPIHPPVSVNGIVSTQRGISRKHVKIAYNFDRNVFEMEVIGRNGAFIGADWLAPGQVRPLHSGDYIQIGGVRLRFVLPDVPVPDDIDIDDEEQLQMEDDEGVEVENGNDDNYDADEGGEGDYDINGNAPNKRISSTDAEDPDDDLPPVESPVKARSKTKARRRSNSDSPSVVERPPKSKKEKRKKIHKINLKLGPQFASAEGSSSGGKSKMNKSLKTIGSKKLSKEEEKEERREERREEKREEKRNKEAPLMTAPVIGPDGTILIPARRRGPGRPPKDGIMSKRERAELAREKKIAARRDVSTFGELMSPTSGQPFHDSQIPQQSLSQQQQQQHLEQHVLSSLPTANGKENISIASAGNPGANGFDEMAGAKAEKRKYTKRKRGDENVMPSIEEGSETAAVGASSAMASGSGATSSLMTGTGEVGGGGSVDPSPMTARLSAKKRKMSRSPSPNYPPESAYSADDLAKPPYNYAVLIFDALSDAQSPMTLKQIYRALKSKYPYFRFRCETEGWTSSVRHNLNGNSHLFEHAERDGKGWSWKLISGASVDKEKKRRPTPPPSIPPGQSQSMHQLNTQGTGYSDTPQPLQPSATAFKLSPAMNTTRYTTLQPQPQPQPQPQSQPQPHSQSQSVPQSQIQSQHCQPPNPNGAPAAPQVHHNNNNAAMNSFRQQSTTIRPQASVPQQPTYTPPSSAAAAAVAAAAALTEGRLDGNGNPTGITTQAASAAAKLSSTIVSGSRTPLPPPPQQRQGEADSSSLPFASATAAMQNNNNANNNPPQSQGQQQHSFPVVPPPPAASNAGQPSSASASSTSTPFFPPPSQTNQYQKPPIPLPPPQQQQQQPHQPSQIQTQHQHQHQNPNQQTPLPQPQQQQQQQQHPSSSSTTTTTTTTNTSPAIQVPKSQSFLDRANAAIDNFESILMEDTEDREYLKSVLRSARRRVLHGVLESEVPGGETKDERVIVDAIRRVVGGLGGE